MKDFQSELEQDKAGASVFAWVIGAGGNGQGLGLWWCCLMLFLVDSGCCLTMKSEKPLRPTA